MQSVVTATNTCDCTEFKRDIKELLLQISADIKRMKRSHTYEIKKLEEKMDFYFACKSESRSLPELKSFLGLSEPFTTLDSFREFEIKLEADNCFLDALRELIAFKVRARSLTEALNNFLSFLLHPQLQVLFSGCGKTNKGSTKENFSSTITYNTLKDAILTQFLAETEANILTKTSRWFANSTDRYARWYTKVN